ncbi:hexulose-6-phosphate isomerase [Agrococcus baldri]|uniref:Hexulose-6-phosphate isomerase n=1 Tax=Agrococcus baldri TaxID=153730 RepID=A0AA94HMI2_9MICO|nr:L-ribulose-5-phosphate 3-epimerase [Agrococcus baldri]SFS11273.1 hexulose-6-phosphate isomerase [Agrococcus baldri]
MNPSTGGRLLASAAALGIYEKALAGADWAARCSAAAAAGYGFIELSVDDSPQKLARLNWSSTEQHRMRQTAAAAGVRIGTIVLSAHRTYPWGAADDATREIADQLASRAIDLAAGLGADRVQLAGYFSFEGPRHDHARDCYIEGVRRAARLAEHRGVRLAIENMDGTDVLSATDATDLIREIDRDVVRLYPDVGNFAGNGLDAAAELRVALPLADAVQFKDARLGEFRRVPFGDGLVDWPAVFRELSNAAWRGPASIEMWNDDGDHAMAADALDWLRSTPSTAA